MHKRLKYRIRESSIDSFRVAARSSRIGALINEWNIENV